MSADLKDRGHWPSMLAALVDEHPGKSTMELTKALEPTMRGRELERKRKAVHQALTRMVRQGGVGCSVSIEWVRSRRIMVARWFPVDATLPEPSSARSIVKDAIRILGRATPAEIHHRTRLAYSKLYRVCHQLAADGEIVNVAPPPLQCWILPDGDRTPFEVPPHYRQVPKQRAQADKSPPAPRRPREPKPQPSNPPYINPIRARALGLTSGANHVR